jgi:predicted TIM-barrel fold metal-dependent hydrolase
MAGRTRIDVHHHVVPPRYKSWLEANGVTAGGLGIPSWSVKAAIDVMDANETATAVLSVSTPGVDIGGGTRARAKAHEVNEYAAEVCRARPDRFGFFATLTLPDVDSALEEARYALDELDAVGVVLPANVRGRYLGDATFRPLFKELSRRGVVVFVHPSELPGAPVPGLAPYVVDFLLDTTRSAVSMARGGVLDLRNLKIILSHAGGFLPYAAYRVAPFVGSLPIGVEPPPGVEWDPFRAVKLLRRYYFDLALSASPSALPSLLAFAAPGHVLFGSDFPYAPAMLGKAVTSMLDAYELSDDLRRSIDRGAAEALFPRLATAGGSASPRPARRRPRWWP